MTRSILSALAAALALPALGPAATAETRPADFAGVWESFGRRPPGARPAAPDGSTPLGGPRPETGNRRGPPIPEADAALGLDQGDIRVRSLMTPAGRQKFAAFTPAEHPMNNCLSPGLPTVMGMPGLKEFRVVDGQVSIRTDTWPEERIAVLAAAPPADAPLSRTGTATARIEGDALVITTRNLAEAWGGLARNAPGSGERSVVETYRLAGPDRLVGEIVVTDPLFLRQPLRMPVTLQRAGTDVAIEVFPCDLEAARRLTRD